jgi:hypothetical protein
MEVLELGGPIAVRAEADRATAVLEAGGLVLFPRRAFALSDAEQGLLDPAISNGRSKNVSLDPASGEVRGAEVDDARREVLAGMIGRFAATADAILDEITPSYGPALQRRRTSFRPGAIAHRALSPRKDDRRLHVDAFPSNPTRGRRILRVFANVNPRGEARVWNVGEEAFEPTARRFRPRLTARGRTAGLKATLGLTRGRQSAYDQVMLQLHDAAKLDEAYQQSAPKRRLDLPAGSMWVVYTDSVMHAALSGQHAFEQTYLLPPDAMREPELSPLRVLERVTGRTLV